MKTFSLSFCKSMCLASALFVSFIFAQTQGFAQENVSVKATAGMDSNAMPSHAVADASKDIVSIQNNNGAHGIVKIYSPSGKKLIDAILQAGANTMDISELPRGEYFVCVTMDGGATYSQKFSKE